MVVPILGSLEQLGLDLRIGSEVVAQGLGLANHHGLTSIVVTLKVVSDEICPLRAEADRGGEEFLLYTPEAQRFLFLLNRLNLFSHTYCSISSYYNISELLITSNLIEKVIGPYHGLT
jgi:hypothetical protein